MRLSFKIFGGREIAIRAKYDACVVKHVNISCRGRHVPGTETSKYWNTI